MIDDLIELDEILDMKKLDLNIGTYYCIQQLLYDYGGTCKKKHNRNDWAYCKTNDYIEHKIENFKYML